MRDETLNKTSATTGILLWIIVAAALAYGVINTALNVADLFAG
jgi:hypothetical protein